MTILANHTEMSRLAARVNQASTVADDEIRSCRTQLATLQDSFQGSTATAFHERYEEWSAAATQLTEALLGLGQWLQGASDTLEAHDQGGAQSLRG